MRDTLDSGEVTGIFIIRLISRSMVFHTCSGGFFSSSRFRKSAASAPTPSLSPSSSCKTFISSRRKYSRWFWSIRCFVLPSISFLISRTARSCRISATTASRRSIGFSISRRYCLRCTGISSPVATISARSPGIFAVVIFPSRSTEVVFGTRFIYSSYCSTAIRISASMYVSGSPSKSCPMVVILA